MSRGSNELGEAVYPVNKTLFTRPIIGSRPERPGSCKALIDLSAHEKGIRREEEIAGICPVFFIPELTGPLFWSFHDTIQGRVHGYDYFSHVVLLWLLNFKMCIIPQQREQGLV